MSELEPFDQTPDNLPEAGPGPRTPALRGQADAGSPRARLIAFIVLLVGVLSVAVMQQLSLAHTADQDEIAEAEIGEILAPTSGDPDLLMSKMSVKIARAFDEPEAMGPLLSQVETMAYSGPDLLRAAVVAYELGLDDDGERLLEKAVGAAEVSPILADVVYVRAVYGGEEAIEPDGFAERHGWYAELVRTAPLPEGDPARESLRSGGGLLVTLMLLAFAIIIFALLAGLGLFIAAIVLLATGSKIVRPRFRAPGVGGSVYLEAAAIFVVGFLLVQLLGGALALWLPERTILLVSLASQWLLLLAPAWPLVRGVSLDRLRTDLGLHAPGGVLRELGAGLMMYLAWVPVFVSVVVVSAMLMILWQAASGAETGEPPSNPIIDFLSGADALGLVLFATLAVLWAPLAEELIFRGCLYRHARSRVGVIIAAVLSAGAFGVMHGYHFIMLAPVISLGVLFALMREWRGSLIGPMFAHFLHNGTLIGLLIGIFSQLG